ncbi:MAG: hypothetical protein EBY23_02375 [Actinobacteria bacterium]|nr:hypothetical protein [Actinomycetota bacterium]
MPSKYFAGIAPPEIEAPSVPHKNDYALGDQLNQLDVYFILARTLGAPQALKLSDMWGNGYYTAYRAHDKNGKGRFCVSINVAGITDADTQNISAAFSTWAKNPTLIDAKVDEVDHHVAISACDPGAKAKHSLPTADDTSQIFWRSSDMALIVTTKELARSMSPLLLTPIHIAKS